MQAKDNKMEHIGKIVAYLILAINAFFVGTLILSAYSPYLNPKLNPLSCLLYTSDAADEL